PNYTAAKAKTARDLAYATSDATTNAEAAIAQMIQSGKLSGLGGMSSAGATGRGQGLQGLNAMTKLYGTTPAQSALFGNQTLQALGQGVQTQGLQNEILKTLIGGQNEAAKVPGNFAQGLGNVAGIGNLIGGGASMLSGFPGLF